MLRGKHVEVLPGIGGLADEHLKPGQLAAQHVVLGVPAHRGFGQSEGPTDVLAAEFAGAGLLEREVGEFRHDLVATRPYGEVALEHGDRLLRTIGLLRLMGERDQTARIPPTLEPPHAGERSHSHDARYDQREQQPEVDAFHGKENSRTRIRITRRSLELPTPAFYQSHPPKQRNWPFRPKIGGLRGRYLSGRKFRS